MALRRTFDSLTPAAQQWAMFPQRWGRKAAKMMLGIGAYIAEESRKRAPVLKGNIEASHKVIMKRRDSQVISVAVEVGDDSTADYLDFIHESTYNLGPLSQKKQAANGDVIVGRKFLERAVNEAEEDIVKQIADELFGEIK